MHAASILRGALMRSRQHADRSATGAGTAFDVAIEAGAPASAPVRRLIVIRRRPHAHKAEEDVTRRPHYNARVSPPHNQVSGLWLTHTVKPLNSGIQITRTGIGVGKTCFLINRVHQVGAVVTTPHADPGIERSRNHRQTIVLAESPFHFLSIVSRCLRRSCRRCGTRARR